MVPRVWSLMRCVGLPGGPRAPEKVPSCGHPLRFAPDWIFEFRGFRSPHRPDGETEVQAGRGFPRSPVASFPRPSEPLSPDCVRDSSEPQLPPP